MGKDVESIILKQLEDLSHQVSGIRTEDLPKLQTKLALVEERASRAAKVTAATIATLGLLSSIAVAYFKH